MKKIVTGFAGIATIFLLSSISLSAAAVGFNFMKNSPISRFDDTDLEIFNTAVINALDSAADGQVVRWENPDSGHNGQIFLLGTDETGPQLCRRMRLANVAGTLTSNLHYNACRDDVAGWQIVPAQEPAQSASESPL